MPPQPAPRPGPERPAAPCSLADRAVDLALGALIGAALRLPWRARLRVVGAVVAWGIGPLAGWRRRVLSNLALACPQMPMPERRRLARAAPANAGRTMIESFSGAEFRARAAAAELVGAGLPALAAAQAEGRPVFLLSGHFGNYDVIRAHFAAKGLRMGALYRPLTNPCFNARYVRAMAEVSEPIFPATRQGMGQMMRHVRAGGAMGVLIDLHSHGGVPIAFFGAPAHTATGAVEIALRAGALILPVFALRLDDLGHYRIEVEAPLAPGTAAEVTQAFHTRLEAQVRAHMAQYFWIHRRWKKYLRERDAA